MNIFFLDKDPEKAASYYCNRRCIKIILEVTQMLCNVYTLQNIEDVPYKLAHVNHPMSKWVRLTKENFNWAIKHGLALCKEYTERYKKEHACYKYLVYLRDNQDQLEFEQVGFTEPPRCFGDYKDKISPDLDIVEAYRTYYKTKPLCVWPEGKTPEWW